MLNCLLDESVSYDDWANSCGTWFGLADKCSLHHMFSLATDFYGSGIMKDAVAFQKPMVWFRFAKSCHRCGRLADAQLAMKVCSNEGPLLHVMCTHNLTYHSKPCAAMRTTSSCSRRTSTSPRKCGTCPAPWVGP